MHTKETAKGKKRELALEILARDTNIKQKELAQKLNVSGAAVSKWMKDPVFVDAIYDKFMILAGKHLPSVVMALINEAKEGNVRAAELVLKHFNKLQDRVHIEINAPFMQFMNRERIEVAEIVEEDAKMIGENMAVLDSAELPPRNPDANRRNNPKNALNIKNYIKPRPKPKEKVILVKKPKKRGSYKKRKYLQDINSRYFLRKRAKAVGHRKMKPGKPTESERKKWLRELCELEHQQEIWYTDHDEILK